MPLMSSPNPENRRPSDAQYEDGLKIAEKIRTGEYFNEARQMYDLSVHDPMSERYMYIFVTAISLLIFFIAFSAMQGLYPLDTDVPFIVSTSDPYDEIPRIKPLLDSKDDYSSEKQGTDEAVLLFMIRHFVTVREQYDIGTFDRDVNTIKSQSSPELFAEYQKYIDPHNPDSPITLYQRHSKRTINILAIRPAEDGGMEVIFEATVEGKSDIKKSHWRANIAFQYSGVELDEKRDTVKPMSFVVTKYHSKRLQDIR